MLFLEYPKCSTCKKAKKWLDENGVEYTDRHIKDDNPSYDELKQWYERSVIFADIKMPEMTGIELLKRIREEEISDAFYIILTGFKEAQWAELLLGK